MAKIEAIQAGGEEGVMLNEQGYVAECTGDNIFIVKNGSITTPPVTAGALDGITRRADLRHRRRTRHPLRRGQMTRYDIFTADECFLTGTAAEVVPVVKLDQRTDR